MNKNKTCKCLEAGPCLASKLCFEDSIACLFSLFVCGFTVSSYLLRFSAFWLSWRSQMTPWERLHSSVPPLHFPPSFHFSFSPSFLSCVLISLLCGSWYVDFIKFSSGWVTEKRGKDQGSHQLFPAFICLLSFIPSGGLQLLGPHGEKVAQELVPFFGGHWTLGQLSDSISRFEGGK